MADSPFTPVDRKLGLLQKEWSGAAGRARVMAVAKAVAPLVDEAVRRTPADRGSLADGSMSGWRRSKPIVLVGKVTVSGAEVAIEPNAKGPMRVLESGRQASVQGPLITSGGKSGIRKVSRARRKRFSVASQGKGTWTDATDMIVKAAPPLMSKQLEMSMGKFFTKG
jgi:hypothetical protein